MACVGALRTCGAPAPLTLGVRLQQSNRKIVMRPLSPILLLSISTALIAGCATQEVALPANLSAAPTSEEIGSAPIGNCPLTIYRNQTSFKAISFDFDLPVAYINDVPVGKLRVGQSHCANVKPGRYLITVKEPNLFGPVDKAKTVIEVKQGQPIFLRFAMEFGSMAVIGTAVSMSTENSLQFVSEKAWQDRL